MQGGSLEGSSALYEGEAIGAGVWGRGDALD